MPAFGFRSPRLHLDAPFGPGSEVELERQQAHYLVHVMRLGEDSAILAFNGRDGEWRARLASAGGKRWKLVIGEQARPQPPAGDLDYLFVPLKQARLDYMVQKAVEMGVSRLRPVLSDHGQVRKLNLDRMAANVIEAAEQCGVLTLPAIHEPAPLDRLLDGWAEEGRTLVFCDEGAGETDPLTILAGLPAGPLAVLIGPEGGFSDAERARLRALPGAVALPLGPRILRADTAAVAALALVQAACGDWRARAPAEGG